MLFVFLSLASILTIITIIPEFSNARPIYAQQNSINNSSHPNINATNVIDTKTMVLGNDIKYIVILLPNEALFT